MVGPSQTDNGSPSSISSDSVATGGILRNCSYACLDASQSNLAYSEGCKLKAK